MKDPVVFVVSHQQSCAWNESRLCRHLLFTQLSSFAVCPVFGINQSDKQILVEFRLKFRGKLKQMVLVCDSEIRNIFEVRVIEYTLHVEIPAD